MTRLSRLGLVALATCLSSQHALAQQTSAYVSVTAPLDSQYVGDLMALHDKVLALANAISADKYSWRPSNDVRTVSQVLTHIAGEWFVLCPRSVASRPPADFDAPGEAMRKLEEITTKAEVLAQLTRSWDYCSSVLSRIDPAKLIPDSLPARMSFQRVVLLVSGDQHEHLGQLIAYARSVGVTPPWSK
jgi:uncharacterized damage-inducible protein DinB